MKYSLFKDKDIRFLGLDLDGTVLTDDKRLTQRTAETLTEAAKAGILVVPITGRPLSGIPEDILGLPGIRYVISSNGAVTTDLAAHKRLRGEYLSKDAALRITEEVMRRGLLHSVFIDDIGWCEEAFYRRQTERFDPTPLKAYVRASRRPAENIFRLIEECESGVENLWFIARSRQERDELNAWIRENRDVHTVLTADRDVETGNPAADKGLALTELAESFGIAREQTVSFGDNDNDLGMLRAAGIAVAMGNGLEKVKKEADLVAKSNEEDGAAEVIEQILYYRRQLTAHA